MGHIRGDPRLLIAAAAGEVRDRLATTFADLAPLVSLPSQAALPDILSRASSVQAMLIVETGEAAALDLLRNVKAACPTLAVFVLSRTLTVEHATELVRSGAEDFVPIPFSNEVLRKEVDRALEAAALRDGIAELRTLVSTAYGFEQIVTRSASMRPVFERVQAAARSDTPVLITGETGTGKELLARAIHANSHRRDRAFVPVNCAALPHDLIESELFGHRRGAFSSAHTDHAGLFASAHRGTLMLDEIGELPREAQAKLLRVLQDGEVRPVGGLESRRVDVRMIAATNRSVPELRNGALRQDLFFRLSVLIIQVPPLRDRPEDIPGLVEHFLSGYRDRGAARHRLTPEAVDVLISYRFPGNVRELRNLVENLCATMPNDRADIMSDDVKAWFRRQGLVGAASPVPRDEDDRPPLELKALEMWAIRSAIERSHGNKSKAAALLGISRDSLYRKLHESGDLPSDSRTVLPKASRNVT